MTEWTAERIAGFREWARVFVDKALGIEIDQVADEIERCHGEITELKQQNARLQRDLDQAFMELTLEAKQRITQRCPLFNTGINDEVSDGQD